MTHLARGSHYDSRVAAAAHWIATSTEIAITRNLFLLLILSGS